jgi:mycothiol synthase
MSPATLSTTTELSEPARTDVQRLVAAATDADGPAPLSEQFLLDLRPGSAAAHALAYAGPDLVGYAQLSDGAAELVVLPAARRQGLGTALLESLPAQVRVWAHGDLPQAAAFAQARGLEVVRELYLLGRSVADEALLDQPVLPGGLTVRTFEPGRDEDEWLRVNAAAFRHHAEQGRLTRAHLDARMTESWFDSSGFLLVVPTDQQDSIAAFHWTKTHRARGTGEVYVVGVDPAYQGKGLGRPVALLGLHHLRQAGASDVTLYVDGDNPAALKIYGDLGFTTRGIDRMYSHGVHRAVER